MQEIKKPNFVKNKKLVKTMTFATALMVASLLLFSSIGAELQKSTVSNPLKINNVNNVATSGVANNFKYRDSNYAQIQPENLYVAPRGVPFLSEGFEGGVIPTGWLNIDNDGDTYIWNIVVSPSHPAHTGLYSAMSASWDSVAGVLYPDNWLITPVIDLTTTEDVIELSYWVAAQDPSYAQEHIEVWISTTNPSISSFTTQIDDYTCPAGSSDFFERIVSLTAYKNIPTVYLAFRHCESSDWFQIKIDDVNVYSYSGVENDVGVTEIIAPASGTATGPITPKVIVENFGSQAQEDVPVEMKISKYGSPINIWCDGFEDFTVGYYDLPTGWTIQTTNPNGTWYMYASTTTYSAATYPRVQEAGSDGNAQDESLISPVIDCSALSTVELRLPYFYFYAYTSDFATATIYVTNDSGATWNTVASYNATSTGAKNLNVTSYAAGHSNVQFKFRFESPADATLNSYWYFDYMWVGDPTVGAWGTYGDNPPLGWTIERFDNTSWDANHWYKYSSSSYDMYGSAARIAYLTPYPEINDNLTSPSINCSDLSKVILQFNCYFYSYTSYLNEGYVQVSIDGGEWQDVDDYKIVPPGSYGYSIQYEWYNGYDITSLAAGHSDVKVRFKFTRPAGKTSGYWYLDNVRVHDGSGSFKFIETFDASTSSLDGSGGCVYFTNFKNYIHDNWGGKWDWKFARAPYYNNKWQNVISGTTPTCVPYEGTRMAQYYNVYQGMKAMLFSFPIDVSSANILKMSFWMYHDSIVGAAKIEVLASHDGITWENMASFNRNDGRVNNWYQEIVDLNGYEDDAAMQIAFLGTSDYVSYMNLDYVCLFDPGLVVEYTNTTYVDIGAKASVEVEFDPWTPAAWQTQEDEEFLYDLFATTDLEGDSDTTNDAESSTITIYYPYYYDVEATSIESPNENGPGQELDVKAKITNVGQYAVSGFFVPFQIGQKVYNTDGWFNNFEANDGGFVQTGSQWQWGTPTSGPLAAYSGVKLWATQLAGNYVAGQATLDTVPITVPLGGDLTFWHWYDFEASYDGYNVKISTDNGTTWTILVPIGGYTGTANTANPLNGQPIWTGHVQMFWEYETFDLEAYENQTVKFRFDFGADGSVFYPGTYIDDILVGTLEITIDSEYNETEAVTESLLPGGSVVLEYPTWRPENLDIGQVSGDFEYGVLAETQLSTDTNPGNDQALAEIILSYWHDVEVKEITSPSVIIERDPWDLLFSYNLETASGALGNAGAEWDGTYFYSTRWASNLIHQYDISGVKTKEFSIPGVTGLRDLAYNPITGTFFGGAAAGTIWEMDFDSQTLVRTITGSFQSRAIAYNHDDDLIYCSNFADPAWSVDPATGAIVSTFNLGLAATYGFGYDNTETNKYLYVFDQGGGTGTAQYIYEWDLDAGAMTGFSYNVALDFPAASGIAGGLFVGDGFAANKMVIGGCLQGTPDMMFVYELRPGGGGGPGPGGINIYIPPTNDVPIQTIVRNKGTFDENDLTCTADIYEFITDPNNGTLVYSEEHIDIDLEPLGDEQTLDFASFDFDQEGVYQLFIEMPLENDDTQSNNLKKFGVGVDNTKPESIHGLTPETPDGFNGWYVNNVKVKLEAEDPEVKGVSSGVKEIRYKVDNDPEKVYTAEFTVSSDGPHTVVYYAVDNVGNVEEQNTVEFKIDKGKPEITLAYEVTGGSAWQGYTLTFTATAADEQSGMDRVEWYYNNVYQNVTYGEGPTYIWILENYDPNLDVTIKALGYDNAGNSASDQVERPESHSQQQSMPNGVLKTKLNLGR